MDHLAVCKEKITELPPCALQASENRLYCGSYKLDEATSTRRGSIEIYDHDLNLLEMKEINDSSILDIRLHTNKLLAAHSTGKISLWSTDNDKFTELSSIQVHEDPSLLVLQLDYSPTEPALIASTCTDGSVTVTDLESTTAVYSAQSHTLEAWTCHFDAADSNGLYTGGDDMMLCYHDIRAPGAQWQIRAHDAGITSLLTWDQSPETLWTGGYDDVLKIFDTKMHRRRSEQSLGGGVWRLVPDFRAATVLACCMYNGAYLLKCSSVEQQPEPIAHLDTHGSMVYGGAWLSDGCGVTCSFYDRLLLSWTIPQV